MNKADTLQNLSDRIPLYNQAEQGLVDNVSSCTLFQLNLNYVVRSNVSGYKLDAQGNVPTPDWPKVSVN